MVISALLIVVCKKNICDWFLSVLLIGKCTSLQYCTFYTHIFNGYQVIVPSWHTISLHSYKSHSTFPFTVCVHCAVTIAFLFIYAHFLNCTWGLILTSLSMWECAFVYVCMREEREREKEKKKEKEKVRGRGRGRKCVYLNGHTLVNGPILCY